MTTMMTYELNSRREAVDFLLPLISLVVLYWAVAAQAFLTTPPNRGTKRDITPATTVTVAHWSDTTKPFGTVNHKTDSIKRSVATVALQAGLFGEQTKFKNQNQTYISPTSVSVSLISSSAVHAQTYSFE